MKCNWFLWSKLNFHHHYSSLQCHMIFRNHSNMLESRNISNFINAENSCAAQYFCGNSDALPFKSLKSERFYLLKKWMLSFIKDAWNWSKVTVNTFVMFLKISISNKSCSFDLSIHQWILKIFFPTKIQHWFKNSALITEINYILQYIP